MKLSQISSKEIEILKGKCLKCENGVFSGKIKDTEGYTVTLCPFCKGTGQATIEIEKEYISATFGGKEFQKKIKIPKYKVGDEIEIRLYGDAQRKRLFIGKLKLKIISETEKTWKVVMVK